MTQTLPPRSYGDREERALPSAGGCGKAAQSKAPGLTSGLSRGESTRTGREGRTPQALWEWAAAISPIHSLMQPVGSKHSLS